MPTHAWHACPFRLSRLDPSFFLFTIGEVRNLRVYNLFVRSPFLPIIIISLGRLPKCSNIPISKQRIGVSNAVAGGRITFTHP